MPDASVPQPNDPAEAGTSSAPSHPRPAGGAPGEAGGGGRWSSYLAYVLAAALFAGGIVMVLRGRTASSIPVAAQPGARAPEFDLEVLGKPGEHVSLAGLRGRPVLLVFNCGCKLCYDFNHALVAAAPKLPDAQFIGVMMNHWSYAPNQIRNFRETTGFRWPLLMDNKSHTTIEYHSTACPRAWLIDRDGIIRYSNEDNTAAPEKITGEILAAYQKL
jgi:peroxiredoxin